MIKKIECPPKNHVCCFVIYNIIRLLLTTNNMKKFSSEPNFFASIVAFFLYFALSALNSLESGSKPRALPSAKLCYAVGVSPERA